MKIPQAALFAAPLLVAAALIGSNLLAQAPAQAPAAAAPALAGGFAAGTLTPGLGIPFSSLYRGTSKGILDDVQLTDITKMEEGMEKEMAAVTPAQEALLKATFAAPRNDADIKAKLDALVTAELALALRRADGWATYQRSHKLSGTQVQAVAKMIGSGAVAPGGGRGN